MPTEHKKKKIKTEESKEVHPLSYYIDDRVELIRQIFGCLKSKTIKSIAPDFLQNESLENIQELCLDELLGISKKRLLSIINATKCPADTESDSSDSDALKTIEEHISLEEISSDSDDALTTRTKKKVKQTSKKSRNGTAIDNTKTEETTGPKKQVSVLELLELQARARAIRSQLALEPITKIEIDSDNEDFTKTTTSKSKDASADIGSTTKEANNTAESSPKSEPKEPEIKPVRLKRNFRERQAENYEEENVNPTESPATAAAVSSLKIGSIEVLPKTTSEEATTVENVVVVAASSNSTETIKEERSKERSPSPDIVTIVKSPETFCISSESENEDENFLKKIKSSSYISFPVEVVKEHRPETEDEKFLRLIKEKEALILENSSITVVAPDTEQQPISPKSDEPHSTEKNAEQIIDTVEDIISNGKEKKSAEEPSNAEEKVEEEQEEGEITDDEEEEQTADKDSVAEIEANVAVPVTSLEIQISSESESEGDEINKSKPSSSKRSSSRNTSSSCSESDDDAHDKDNSKKMKLESIEIDDDDIIDLGKDEELDFDAEENEDTINKKKKATVDEEDVPDPENDTWGKRWLRGKNVKKVLATSRLANKVRSKIKQTKKTQLDSAEAERLEAAAAALLEDNKSTPAENVEEGSVKHYEELVSNSPPRQ